MKLRAGNNKVSLLSVAVGLPVSSLLLTKVRVLGCKSYYGIHSHIVHFQNVGVHFETWNTGVLGPVTLKGLNEGTRDLTNQKWSYKVRCHNSFLLHFSVIRLPAFKVKVQAIMKLEYLLAVFGSWICGGVCEGKVDEGFYLIFFSCTMKKS